MNSFYKTKPQHKWTWLKQQKIKLIRYYLLKTYTLLNIQPAINSPQVTIIGWSERTIFINSNCKMKRKLNGNSEQLDITKLALNKTIDVKTEIVQKEKIILLHQRQ